MYWKVIRLKGLIIKEPYISDILKGTKTWELRGSTTKIRGQIVLLKSGTKTAIGTVEIVDVKELTLDDYNSWDYRILYNKEPVNELPYKRTYAYILKNPKSFANPKAYIHPNGAIIWVNLDDDFLDNIK